MVYPPCRGHAVCKAGLGGAGHAALAGDGESGAAGQQVAVAAQVGEPGAVRVGPAEILTDLQRNTQDIQHWLYRLYLRTIRFTV